jgi:hypothetical protein
MRDSGYVPPCTANPEPLTVTDDGFAYVWSLFCDDRGGYWWRQSDGADDVVWHGPFVEHQECDGGEFGDQADLDAACDWLEERLPA